jgi:hypothetical protein
LLRFSKQLEGLDVNELGEGFSTAQKSALGYDDSIVVVMDGDENVIPFSNKQPPFNQIKSNFQCPPPPIQRNKRIKYEVETMESLEACASKFTPNRRKVFVL